MKTKKLLSLFLTLALVLTALAPAAAVPAWADDSPAPTTEWSDFENRDANWGEGDAYQNASITISTAAELAQLAYLVNSEKAFENTTVTLTADLDLSAHKWTPIGDRSGCVFKGTFDGGGHTVSGMYINYSPDYTFYAGLFGCLNMGTVKNLNVSGSISATVKESTEAYVGGVVGYSRGDSETKSIVENCCFSGSISVTGSLNANIRAGGIVGYNYNYGTVDNCCHSGSVKAKGPSTTYIGGIVGVNKSNSTVAKCCHNGSIISTEGSNSNAYAGGVVGCNESSTVRNCCGCGNIKAATGSERDAACAIAGGVVGTNNEYDGKKSTVTNCYHYGGAVTANTNPTSGNTAAGGVVGYNNKSEVTNCYHSGGAVTAKTNGTSGNTAAGGVVGIKQWPEDTVSQCYYLSEDTVANGIGLNGVNGAATDVGASPLTAELFAQESSFSEWTFEGEKAAWIMAGTRPILRAFAATVTTWSGLRDALGHDGIVTLGEDVTWSAGDAELTVPDTAAVILDLNGKTIDRKNTSATALTVVGDLTLSGSGTITGGATGVSAGGAFAVSGAPVITGSTASVYLPAGKTITVAGALTAGASIGVTTETKPTADTRVTITKGLKANDQTAALGSAANFFSDSVTYSVKPDGPEAALILSPVVTFNANYGETPSETTQTVPYDTPTPLEANAFTRTGWTFTRWKDAGNTYYTDKDTVTLTENLTLYAQWTLNTYTVTWKNEDGTVLKTEQVDYGATPEYTGDTPEKAADAAYTYAFKAWTPEIAPVTGDVEYTATYTRKAHIVDDGGYAAPAAPATTISVSGSIKLSVTVSGSTVTVAALSASQLDQIAKSDEPVVFDLTALGENITSVRIPADTFVKLAEALAQRPEGADKSVTIQTALGEVTFDAAAVKAIAACATDGFVTLDFSLKGVEDLSEVQQAALEGMEVLGSYSLSMMAGAAQVVGFEGGAALVAVPFTPADGTDGADYVFYYVSPDGRIEKMETYYENGKLHVTVPHFSDYVLVYEPQEKTRPFADVAADAWYYAAVYDCFDRGLMNGMRDDAFEPETPTSRAMVVTMLWRLAGEPAVDCLLRFDDVPEDTWYTEAVRWAASEGIVTGYDETTFAPEDLVTREQLATILYRYAQSKGLGFTGAWYFPLNFTDAAQISEWADEAMHWMVMNEIINGMGDGTLNPGGNATRAQVAAMFMRFAECAE